MMNCTKRAVKFTTFFPIMQDVEKKATKYCKYCGVGAEFSETGIFL